MLYTNLFINEIKKENSESNVTKNIKKYNEVIIPFYKSKGVSEQFNGVGDIPIACRIFHSPNAKAKIILCTGYNESYLKYSELIMDLCEFGFSVYCYDHRGQGFSGRFPDQNKKGYVDKFENYVDDLCYFFEQVSRNNNHLPIFILAHSMGGAISSLAANEKKINPNGIILCAPMFEIMLTPYSIFELPVFFLSTILCKLKFDKEFVFGQTDCIPFRPFEGNDVTHCNSRYSVWRKHISEIEDMQLGGPTFQWIKEAIQSSRKARFLSKQNQISVLLLQAEKDTVVRNSAQDLFHKNSPNCEKIVLELSKHEILMEIDLIRNKAIESIKNFILQKIPK